MCFNWQELISVLLGAIASYFAGHYVGKQNKKE